MVKLKSQKKGAELPLNTIVIALLVIIVLVVIITFFMSRVGQAGEDLDASSDGYKECSVGTYQISADDYSDAGYSTEKSDGDVNSCGKDWTRIYTIPKTDKGVCCALPKDSE